MDDFNPDEFLKGQQATQTSASTTSQDDGGFDPDAFLSGQRAAQEHPTKQIGEDLVVAPQGVVAGELGYNPAAIARTATNIGKNAGGAAMNYLKNPVNVVTDVALAHMGVPPVAAGKSLYDTYQQAKEAAAHAAKTTSQSATPKFLDTYYDPLKAGVQAEHPELLKPIQEAFKKSGPQGVKNFLGSSEGAKIMNNPATRDAAEAFISQVPGVMTQVGKVAMPLVRTVGKVAGPVGIGMNLYDAGQMARDTQLGERLANGQGQMAQHAYRQIPSQINTPQNPMPGTPAFAQLQQQYTASVAHQPPTEQNFLQRMAAYAKMYHGF